MQAESQQFQSLSHAIHLQWWLSLLPRSFDSRAAIGDSRALTGCLSTLSLPAAVENTFSNSLAEFARALRAGGAADVAMSREVPTDYRSMTDAEASAEVIAALPDCTRISDETIEELGYMGWLTGMPRSA